MTPHGMQHATPYDAIRHDLRAFIASEVRPHARRWEEERRLPIHELVQGLSARGCFGFRFPAEDGGRGLDEWAHLVFAEEIGCIDSGGIGMALTIHGDMVVPMIAQGMRRPGQRAAFLRPALRGDLIFSHAISEQGAGSDPSAIATTARKVEGGYRVSGTKRYISLAPLADMHCIMARLEGRRFPFNMVLMLVDGAAEGVRVVPSGEMMGNHACPVGDVRLNDVFVPDDARIGDEGMGFVLQMRQFVEERVISAARAISSSSALIDETTAFCETREIFAGSLLGLQTVAHRLVDLKAEAASLRALVHDTVRAWMRGETFETASCVAKLRSNQLARKVGTECLKLQGAAGYCAGSNAERFYRDGRLYAISTGSDEAMEIAIGRVLGDPIEHTVPSVSKRPIASDELAGCVRGEFRDTLRALGGAGLLGPCLDTDGFTHMHAMIEASAQALPNDQATSLLTHLDVAGLMMRQGSDAVRASWREELVRGEASFALAITEEAAGSDFGRLETTAVSEEDGSWVLNGAKTYITNGAKVDGHIVLTSMPHAPALARYSLFVVPCDDTVAAAPVSTLGNDGCLGRVVFDATRVSRESAIGRPGQGGLIVQQHLGKERYFIALRCFALARASLHRTALELAKRKTFGAPLATRQALQFRFAGLLSDLVVLRSVLSNLTERVARRSAPLDQIAAAKLRANLALERIADFELQIAAGDGYTDDHPASRLYRDGIGLSIAGGSDGVLRDMQIKSLTFTETV